MRRGLGAVSTRKINDATLEGTKATTRGLRTPRSTRALSKETDDTTTGALNLAPAINDPPQDFTDTVTWYAIEEVANVPPKL
eukprot:1800214-Pyramimonas_sp.AAC.1